MSEKNSTKKKWSSHSLWRFTHFNTLDSIFLCVHWIFFFSLLFFKYHHHHHRLSHLWLFFIFSIERFQHITMMMMVIGDEKNNNNNLHCSLLLSLSLYIYNDILFVSTWIFRRKKNGTKQHRRYVTNKKKFDDNDAIPSSSLLLMSNELNWTKSVKYGV